jgi:vitamin B12 transporter
MGIFNRALFASGWVVGGCFVFFALMNGLVQAQTVLPNVVVTATREPQPLARVAADVLVIDAQRIQASSADSLEDLLQREAGLQLSRNGGPGQNAGVLLRGAGAGSTVVLIDGVRVGSATLGQVQLENLALAQIERIEVLRGPGSSLYGADAVGGVVQIFTRQAESGALNARAHAALGSRASFETSLGLAGTQGLWNYTLALASEGSEGVSALRPGDAFGNYNPDADGFKRHSILIKLGHSPAAGQRLGLMWQASHLRSQYDDSEYLAANAFAQDARPDFVNRLKNEVLALHYETPLSANWTTRLQLAHSSDDSLSGASAKQRYRTQREQLTWQNAWSPQAGQQLVTVLEGLAETAKADVYAQDHQRRNQAAALGYTGQFGVQTLQADVRHDHNSVYGNNTTGRLGWAADLGAGWRLRALAGSTFRAPSFNELYYPGYGVSTVTAERGKSLELGLNWRADDNEMSATIYQNRVRNLITYEPNPTPPNCPPGPAYQYGCARNVGNALMQGATLGGVHHAGRWRFAGTVDFLNAKNSDTEQRLPRRAAHQTSLSVDYEQGRWRHGLALLAVGSRPESGQQLGAYETLNLQTRWQWAPQWQLQAKLLNATQRQFEPALGYQAPGRQAWFGVRYEPKELL